MTTITTMTNNVQILIRKKEDAYFGGCDYLRSSSQLKQFSIEFYNTLKFPNFLM